MKPTMEGSENRIGPCRERAGLKQTELAARLEISRSQLSNIETGTRNVDLPQLRQIARILTAAKPNLPCSVVDLLAPDDAPGWPSEAEATLLAELRAEPGYDPRGLLAAFRGILAACQGLMAAREAPRTLAGDPILVRGLSERWNTMDDGGRQKTLGLLDAAKDFAR